MPDHAIPELPRIAFVFGDDASAAHVREAMHGHADIAYAASADTFDLGQARQVGVSALLVNVDGGDWLEPLETALHGTGVAVVFNDPDISGKLEGWDRARWRRHLLAKMRGSRDVDPPRPASSLAPVDADTVPDPQPEVVDEVAERPLSSHEIETMTADFVAAPPASPTMDDVASAEDAPVAVAAAAEAEAEAEVEAEVEAEAMTPDVAALAEAAAVVEPEPEPEPPAAAESVPEPPVTVAAVSEPAAAAEPVPEPPAAAESMPEPPAVEAEATEPALLDVDTETLSAMIDARLAEPAPRDDEPGEVWRIANDSADDARQAAEDTAGQPDEVVAAATTAASSEPPPAPPATDDVDVLAGLPSLDDWQLVDPDSAAAPAAASNTKPTADVDLSGSLVGIELVPMEVNVPVQIHSEPTEFWLDDEDGSRRAEERIRKERQA